MNMTIARACARTVADVTGLPKGPAALSLLGFLCAMQFVWCAIASLTQHQWIGGAYVAFLCLCAATAVLIVATDLAFGLGRMLGLL